MADLSEPRTEVVDQERGRGEAELGGGVERQERQSVCLQEGIEAPGGLTTT